MQYDVRCYKVAVHCTADEEVSLSSSPAPAGLVTSALRRLDT